MVAERRRSVLVTGAGGFIGSALTAELVRQGFRVRALRRYSARGHLDALRWIDRDIIREVDVVPGDLRDAESVAGAIDGMEQVFHLGAQIAIPYSHVNPRAFVEANVIGTLNVAQAARVQEVERVIHVSTSEVYGTAQRLPMTEDHPLSPQSPYAASKIGADAIMDSYRHSFGLPVVIVRPFNTYGPGQSARAVIPTIVEQALRGDTICLGSLRPRRDFTYVTDTVAALTAAALEPKALGRTFHIGSGQNVSVAELVELVGELMGKRLEIETESRRLRPSGSEVQELLCDSSLARQLIGWSQSVNLRAGLAETIRWIEGRVAAGEELETYRV